VRGWEGGWERETEQGKGDGETSLRVVIRKEERIYGIKDEWNDDEKMKKNANERYKWESLGETCIRLEKN